MSTRWRRGLLGVALGGTLMAGATDAAADGPVHVRLVPLRAAPTPAPLGAPAPPSPATNGDDATAWLDGSLPASASFVVDVRLGDIHVAPESEVIGELHVWPNAVKRCRDGRPAPGADQYHHRAMSLTGTGIDRVLSATLPPLQVGQRFCFDLVVRGAISSFQLEQASSTAATRLTSKLTTTVPQMDCQADALKSDFASALAAALQTVLRKTVDASTAGANAHGHFKLDSLGKCSAAQKAHDLAAKVDRSITGYDLAGRHVRGLEEVHDDLLAALKTANPPANLREPFVHTTGNAVMLASQLIGETSTVAAVKLAASELASRAGNPAYASWAGVLSRFAEDLQTAGADRAKITAVVKKAEDDARKTRPNTVLPLEIWTGTQFEPFGTYKAHAEEVAASDVLAQLALLDRPGVVPIDQEESLKKVRKALSDVQEAKDHLDAMREVKKRRDAEYTTAAGELEQAIASAMRKDDVRQAIQIAVSELKGNELSASGVTPNHANYVSPDLGVILGFPTAGATPQVWVMPYFGLNFYFTAVDRTVPLNQLVGDYGQAFRQRVSLTVGMTLTDPSIPGRTVEKPLGFGNYPLLALGVRLTHFVRITGGAVFYRVADKNPASGDSRLMAAPFVGTSLDADVVHALREGLK